jgi:hypothetical protein
VFKSENAPYEIVLVAAILTITNLLKSSERGVILKVVKGTSQYLFVTIVASEPLQ